MGHDPSREIAHCRRLRRELDTAGARSSPSQEPRSYGHDKSGEEQSSPVLPRLVAEDENRYGEAQCDAARDQEMHQPLGSDQASRDHNH